MKNYYIDTDQKLREIFAEHCNLSGEQYEEIRSRFIYLMCDIQEGEQMENIEDAVSDLGVIFEFLYNTKELTIGEYNELCNLANGMQDDAEKLATEEGAGDSE